MSEDVLIEAEQVSKKFCRSLKRSLWYGARDVASALVHRSAPGESTNGLVHAPALRRDEFWAVKDVSFSLRRGECLGVIGHNGAGKSTLLKMLNGLIPPDGGRITTRGRVAALIELSAGFNPILTGRENIYNQAALLGFSRRETDARFNAIVDFAEIGDFLDMPVQNYSSGMRVRLGFAVAAQMEPDILIIDEVLAVGDVAFRFKCLNAVGEMMRSAAVVFVSHSMPQIFRICTEVMVMDHGVPSYQGRNIADGVAEYLALFHESELAVSGSGEIRVEGLRLQSSSGETDLGGTLRVPFGSDLRVTATVRGAPSVRNARLQFLFWNAEMLPVMEIMGEQLIGHEFALSDSGSAEISASVPAIHLNAGKYTLSVISASPDYSRVYCRHDNAAHVQVEAGSPSGAHVLHVADWVVTG